jgi:PadR family transcriptional regulator, regulatory protein PadR
MRFQSRCRPSEIRKKEWQFALGKFEFASGTDDDPCPNELPAFFPVDILPKRMGHLGRMSTRETNDDRIALLQGTLDLLILKSLVFGPRHGQGIARSIQAQSEDVFLVEHGSLYVALQRLEEKNWLRAKWGVSENNRKARFYSLTIQGREQLAEKASQWRRLTRAVSLILDADPAVQSEEA